jgi:hypothetical protein
MRSAGGALRPAAMQTPRRSSVAFVRRLVREAKRTSPVPGIIA